MLINSTYTFIKWYTVHVVLVNSMRVFRSHLLFDIARALPSLIMNLFNKCLRMWKVWQSCMNCFIGCLNQVYKTWLYIMFTRSTTFQQRIIKVISQNPWTPLHFFININMSKRYVKVYPDLLSVCPCTIRFISHTNILSQTKLRDYHFTLHFGDCIWTDYY